MADRPTCFISYAHVDTDFIYDNIIPILENLNIDVWIAGEQVEYGYSLFDAIIEGIKKSDFIITLLNTRSTFVNLELGTALGNAKPVIAILKDNYELPSDLLHLNYIRYNDNNYQDFQLRLTKAVRTIADNVIDKGTFAYNQGTKILGIKAGNGSDFPNQLAFTFEFISFIQRITYNPEISLIQSAKGSFKSLVSLDLKSWAELLEKIIFFIPELRKRKAERLKIEADVEKTRAETRKIDTETNIQQANAFVDLLERYQKLGIKIQIDDDLLITQSENGQLTFKKPDQIE